MYAHIHPGAHTSAAAASAHSDQRIIPRFTARTALQIFAIRIAILKCSRLMRLLFRSFGSLLKRIQKIEKRDQNLRRPCCAKKLSQLCFFHIISRTSLLSHPTFATWPKQEPSWLQLFFERKQVCPLLLFYIAANLFNIAANRRLLYLHSNVSASILMNFSLKTLYRTCRKKFYKI